MGSNTKKHKGEKNRDSRKRKHRSRSRSPGERPNRTEVLDRTERDRDKEREKHRHSKKHHKDRKREKHSPTSRERNGEQGGRPFKPEESDSEDGGGPAVPPPPKISRARSPPSPPSIASASNSDTSLSISETNRLRAKLGLKPLQMEPTEVSADAPVKSAAELMGGKDMGEFVHKPAVNTNVKKKEEKLRTRLTERRERRAMEAKLSKVKALGEDSENEDDASAWVQRSRRMQEERDKANKRAKMLEELDAEFGVGELVQGEFRQDAKEAYSTKDLRGLTVEHNMDNFTEGRAVILTLKDKGVLDEEDDVLINVNIIDDEKYKKNNERKKQKPFLHGYNAYDEEDVDEFGNVQKKLLGKYDEEIGGEKKSSFVIGREVEMERRHREILSVKEKLNRKTLESLELPAMQLASEYYTQEEMVQFKKPKKKVRKIRKKEKVLKASDLEASVATPELSRDLGTRDLGTRVRERPRMDASGFRPVGEGDDDSNPEDGDAEEARPEPGPTQDSDAEDCIMLVDDLPLPMVDLSDVKLEPDEGELELQLALNKARKLKQIEDMLSGTTAQRVAQSVLQMKQEEEEEGAGAGGNITLNATAEFCRTLGDIPTYGLAGNRDEDAEELMDFEREMTEERRRQEEERSQRGAWNEVEVDDAPAEIAPPEAPILDEEPDVGMGVAGALRLAVSKGYLEKETYNRPSASRNSNLNAQNYSIEDKTHIDDDKFGRRERYCGPTTDFKEKDGFKPNVKLDYIDDDGRVLNAKEAFRYLSHKFHGKGPGKNKVEKRMKKVEQEVLMKQMSSTDTPLGTLNMLQQKQKETHSAYVVLSGSKQLQSISKPKM